ncbi:phosphotransferase family protein [Mycobacterium europaeum]|uniref:phosphotransferase family protein n=1 Tax=Mycobacterium europaeum TaxID=761804 RepID=UPI002013910D|nr:phosphotransferase family protein [Mycobacterium europaeum]
MTESATSAGTPGLDMDALQRWLDGALPGDGAGPLTATLLAGGKSNLTYLIQDQQRRWVLRRPPLGHVLATAHDMHREYRVLAALHGTGVPVPAVYAHYAATDVIGAPFYVMEFIDGAVYRTARELAATGPDATAAIAAAMVRVLADLHRVDIHRVGLADLGRPQGYLERQVNRWARQLDASRSRSLPQASTLVGLLRRHVPTETRTTLVHGDFRLDNLLISGTEVHAVIDWEMATLGDPLTDVALLAIYGRLPALVTTPALPDVSRAPGYPSESQLLQAYAVASGHDLRSLTFHLALACFKLAVILEGIHYRHSHGHTVGTGFESVGAAVTPLLEAGIRELSTHSKDY